MYTNAELPQILVFRAGYILREKLNIRPDFVDGNFNTTYVNWQSHRQQSDTLGIKWEN